MASNLFFHYTGGASNDDPDISLGGTGSSERLDTTALNNLFDNVTPDEVLSGEHVEYRAIDLYNEGDAVAQSIEFYFTDTPNTQSTLAVWYDSVGTQSVPNTTTPPVGSPGNWTTPLSDSKLALDTLPAGSAHRLWIRRTVDQDADNIVSDTGTLHAWFS